jgi:hypothetical protein
MFAHFPPSLSADLRPAALLLNTLIVIGSLIVADILYGPAAAGRRTRSRRARLRSHVRVFLPLGLALCGVLVYPVGLQSSVLKDND